jgi:hypothetical protein
MRSVRLLFWALTIATAAVLVFAGTSVAKVNVLWTWPSGQPIEDGSQLELSEELFLNEPRIPPCMTFAVARLLLNGRPMDRFSAEPVASWDECGPYAVSGGYSRVESTSEGVVAIANPPITITAPGPCRYELAQVKGNRDFETWGTATLTQDEAAANCAAQLRVKGSLGPFGPDPNGGGELLRSFRERAGPPVEALEHYWSDIAAHDFGSAYAYLAPGAIPATASQFILSERLARIRRVQFFAKHAVPVLALRGRVPRQVVIPVYLLATSDERSGCRVWSGSYQMIDEQDRWRIARASLTPRQCE